MLQVVSISNENCGLTYMISAKQKHLFTWPPGEEHIYSHPKQDIIRKLNQPEVVLLGSRLFFKFTDVLLPDVEQNWTIFSWTISHFERLLWQHLCCLIGKRSFWSKIKLQLTIPVICLLWRCLSFRHLAYHFRFSMTNFAKSPLIKQVLKWSPAE